MTHPEINERVSRTAASCLRLRHEELHAEPALRVDAQRRLRRNLQRADRPRDVKLKL